jgi:HSP20 family protein
MAIVRFKNATADRSFNNFVDDFFTTMPSLLRSDFTPVVKSNIPVNVKENEKEYVLEVVAPGFEKDSFSVHLDQDQLTISAERKQEAENTDKQIRNEYVYRSFKRSFTLDEKIDAESISAKYVNGILVLNLPKKGEVKQAVKQISIQ